MLLGLIFFESIPRQMIDQKFPPERIDAGTLGWFRVGWASFFRLI
jgi:hypothetical protein